jgi:hypothetical protein
MKTIPEQTVLHPPSSPGGVVRARLLVNVLAAIALLISAALARPLYAQGLQALLVVGNGGSPSAADLAMSNRLVTLGFQVTLVGDAASQVSDATGKSLVLTVASVQSAAVRAKFATVAVPLFNSEQAVLDNDYRMSFGGQGTVNNQTQINVTNANHVLAAGLSGLITVCSSNSLTYGTPNTNGIAIATIAGNPVQKCIFAYETGAEMYSGNFAPARRIHFMLSDATFSGLNTNGLNLFDAAIRWVADLSTQGNSPLITGISPAEGAIFQPADIDIGFTATTHAANSIPASTNGIQMFLNGVDVSAALVISGTSANRTVLYTNALAPNTLYTVRAVARDNSGREASRIWTFDTMVADAIVGVEAENFNFDGGQYISNPVISSQFEGTNTYYGHGWQLGVPGVDFSELNAATRPPVGTFGAEWRYAAGEGLPQTAESTDIVRPGYTNAGIPDFDLVNIQTNEWWNYTKDFTNYNYSLYLRAKAATDQTVELDRVTGDRTQPGQSTVLLGNFKVAGGGSSFFFTPLIGPDNAEVVLHLSGTQTLRLMALTANNNLNLNHLILVPTADAATVIGPYVQNVSPENGTTSARRDSITATIINRETQVNTNTIQLLVDGLLVTGLTLSNTPTGADVSYAVAPAFAGNSSHTALLRFNDSIGNMFSNTWSFTTSPDALPVFTAPRLENGELKLLVAFARPVDAVTAGEVTNYTSDQGVAFSQVAVVADRVVELTGTPVVDGQACLLTVSHLQDSLGNTVPTTSIAYNISPFLSTNGVVVFEAESYHTNTAGVDPHPGQAWAFSTAFGGYSGGGEMLNPGGGNVALADFATGARLDYRVRFTQPGTYKMWIRSIETSAADSIYYGLDGGYVAAVTGIAVGPFNWNDDPEDAPTTGTNHFTISGPGDHTINVWVREDGLPLDKIMIVLESTDFDPSSINGGLGPNQSPRASQPILLFSRPTPSTLSLNWTSAGFHLEQTASLTNPQWTNTPNGATPPVTLPTTGQQLFFRLSR